MESRNNLARTLLVAGRVIEVLPLYQQTLVDRERVLGPDHPETVTTREWIAAVEQKTDVKTKQGVLMKGRNRDLYHVRALFRE